MAGSKSSKTGAERPHSVAIFLTLLTISVSAIGVWIAWLTYSNGHKSTKKFPIVVFADNAEGNPVYDAEVNLNLPELNAEHTDVKGQVFFVLSKELIGREGRLSIFKSGFEKYNQQVLIEPRSDFYTVYLKKLDPIAQSALENTRSSKLPSQRHRTAGSATSKGDFSPAVSGSGNTINYGSAPPQKKDSDQ